MEDEVVNDLKQGGTIALISDAGTPLISDPGQPLVNRCRKEGIEITAVPGPCAVIDALVLSGFAMDCFQFIGFLPKKEKQLQLVLGKALYYPGTTVAYESPHRIQETLEEINSFFPHRKIAICRELTKVHEEVLMGTASDLLAHFKKASPRGEMVLLISPATGEIFLKDLSLQELVEMLQKDLKLDKREAIKMAAELRHLSKKEVYKLFIPK